MTKHFRQNKFASLLLIWIWFLFFGHHNTFADIPAAFVDIGYGARPMGIGGAFTALSDDAHAIFWNPAGLTQLQKSQLTLMHTKQLGLIPYRLGAFASHYSSHYFGLSFLTSGDEALKENTVIASYARVVRIPLIGKTRFGANLRYRSASFGNNEGGGENRSKGSASGYGFDLGLLWQLNQTTQFGIFGRDIINNMSYDNTARDVQYSEKVPSVLVFGLSRRIHQQAVMGLDWERSLYSDTFDKLHLGGEVTLLNMIILRGGIWQNIDTQINRNYSIGLGLHITRNQLEVQFDVAYLINDLANTPRISLSIFY